MESMSSSRPWRRSVHGSPQRGQRKLCTPSSSTSAAQAAQCTTTGRVLTTSLEPASGVPSVAMPQQNSSESTTTLASAPTRSRTSSTRAAG